MSSSLSFRHFDSAADSLLSHRISSSSHALLGAERDRLKKTPSAHYAPPHGAGVGRSGGGRVHNRRPPCGTEKAGSSSADRKKRRQAPDGGGRKRHPPLASSGAAPYRCPRGDPALPHFVPAIETFRSFAEGSMRHATAETRCRTAGETAYLSNRLVRPQAPLQTTAAL